VFVYHSVRRYQREGVGNLVQKQFKSGFIYLFTGKAFDTDDYKFGTFSRYVMEEREGRRAEHDGTEVKKLLSSFDKQSRRLRTQIEKMEVQSVSSETRALADAHVRPAVRGAQSRKGQKKKK